MVAGVAITLATLVGVQLAEDVRKTNAQITLEESAPPTIQEEAQATTVISGQDSAEEATPQSTPGVMDETSSQSGSLVMPKSNVRIAEDDVTFEEFVQEVELNSPENAKSSDSEIITETAEVKEITQSGIEAGPIAGDVPLTVAFKTKEVSRAQWNFGDGSPLSDAISPEHRYESPGTYTVTLIAQHKNGKVFQDRIIVTVNEPQSDAVKEEEITPEFRVPNVFTPNADGINDYFTFDVPETIESFEINIFNSAGRLVYRATQPSFRWNGEELDGTESPAGTYFYQIKAVDVNHSVYAPKGSITLNR
jgi:gliding motility-associated-like protein